MTNYRWHTDIVTHRNEKLDLEGDISFWAKVGMYCWRVWPCEKDDSALWYRPSQQLSYLVIWYNPHLDLLHSYLSLGLCLRWILIFWELILIHFLVSFEFKFKVFLGFANVSSWWFYREIDWNRYEHRGLRELAGICPGKLLLKTKYFTFSETNVFSFYWRTDNGKEEMVVRKMTESKQPLNCDDKTSSDSR